MAFRVLAGPGFNLPARCRQGNAQNGVVVSSPVPVAGLSYDPRAGEWVLSRDIEVNYLVMAVRQ